MAECVLCRDCIHFRRDFTPHDYEHPHFCVKLGIDLADGDGFCSWGEEDSIGPYAKWRNAAINRLLSSMGEHPIDPEPACDVHFRLGQDKFTRLCLIAEANDVDIERQVIALIDGYRVSKPHINHGDHGPEPRFDGDAWTMWHCCGACDHPVSRGDSYCHTCGAKLDWSDAK